MIKTFITNLCGSGCSGSYYKFRLHHQYTAECVQKRIGDLALRNFLTGPPVMMPLLFSLISIFGLIAIYGG